MVIVLNSLKHNGPFQEWFYCKFKEKDNVCGNMLWEWITSMPNTSYSQQNMLLSLHPKLSEKLCLKVLEEENFLGKRTFIFNYFYTAFEECGMSLWWTFVLPGLWLVPDLLRVSLHWISMTQQQKSGELQGFWTLVLTFITRSVHPKATERWLSAPLSPCKARQRALSTSPVSWSTIQ